MNILDSIKKVIPLTPIGEVRIAPAGETYAVEGTVTAGTTPGNAFFDTIYIQDATGGIDIFPVSGLNIQVGQKVKVIGTVDQYQGDLELRAVDIAVTDPALSPVSPITISTQSAMLEKNEGWLVKVTGTVTRIVNNNLYLNDGSGEARVYLDGYISDGTSNPAMLGKWDPNIVIGDTVSAIGLASQDAEGHRIRVRNSAEIIQVASPLPVITGKTTTSPNVYGWFNTDVTVHFDSIDPYGLLVYLTPDVTLTTEGTSQSVTGTARNIAGKTATCTVENINIDKTAPSIVSSLAASYRLGKRIKLEFSAQDTLSGIAASYVVLNGTQYANGTTILLTQAGLNTVELIARDKAGNIEKVTQTLNVIVPVRIHIAPPVINLRGRNDHWTALITIGLPDDVSADDIQMSSIRINGVVVPVRSKNIRFERRHSRRHCHDEVAAILLQFDKDDLKAVLDRGVEELTITGSTDSFDFEGKCPVIVIK